MPPSSGTDNRTKDALYLIDQIKALEIQVTFNINHVATNTGTKPDSAQAKLLDIKKRTGLDIKTTRTGKSFAGPATINGPSTGKRTLGGMPATAARSSRGRKSKIDHAESADGGNGDREAKEAVQEPTKVPKLGNAGSKLEADKKRQTRSATVQGETSKDTPLPLATKPNLVKSVAKDKKRASKSSSKITGKDAGDDSDDLPSHEQEPKQKIPRTRAERRSAGLEEIEDLRWPATASKGRPGCSSETQNKVQTGEEASIIAGKNSEIAEEDTSHARKADGFAVEEQESREERADESGTAAPMSSVKRLFDETSDNIPGGTKRKRSNTPETPSRTLPDLTLRPEDMMSSTDLFSTPDEVKAEGLTADIDTPSKPPPPKKPKLDAAAGDQDKFGAAAVAYSVVDATVAGSTSEMSSLSPAPQTLGTSTAMAAARKSEDDSVQKVQRLADMLEPFASAAGEEDALGEIKAQASEQVKRANAARAVADNDLEAAAGSTVTPVAVPQIQTKEPKSSFKNPLRWMVYSRDTKPAEAPEALESGVDDQCGHKS